MIKKNYYFSLFLVGICALFFQTANAQRNTFSGVRINKATPEFKALKSATANRPVTANGTTEKYVFLTEDFSKFTAGSEANPDNMELSDPSTDIIPSAYTQVPGWTGEGVYQAGGTCFLNFTTYGGDTWTGMITTPVYKIPSTVTEYKVRLKARSSISIDTLNVASFRAGTTSFINFKEFKLTNAWQEYEVTFYSTSDENTHISIFSDKETCYLDDIELSYQRVVYDGDLPAPVVSYATEIGPNTFTANWESVPGAISYLLNVYSYTDETTKYFYLQDYELTETFCKLERLPENVQFYYTVRATDGEKVSPESEEMKVEERDPEPEPDSPNLLPTTNIIPLQNSVLFTLNWDGMTTINEYTLYLFETYTSDEEQDFVVAYEDFHKIQHGSKDKPEVGGVGVDLDEYTEGAGWIAVLPYFAKGMLGLEGNNGTFIYSPLYDLSAGDGKFKVEVSAMSAPGNTLNVNKACEAQPSAETTEYGNFYFDQEEQKFEKEYTHFNKDATGGVLLAFTLESKVAFIDEFKLTKHLKPGDSFSYIHEGIAFHDKNTKTQSATVEMTTRPGYTYSYAVVVKRSGVAGEPGGIKFYGYNNRLSLDLPLPLSIESTKVNNNSAKTYIQNGDLCVALDNDSFIEVYTISGVLIRSMQGTQGENIIPLADKGMYIVKVGDHVTKIVR